MNKVKTAIIFILVMVIIIYLSLGFFQAKKLTVNFLDIGQGDAIFIRTPRGQNIVIDGGADNLFLYELSDSMPWWDKTIDYLVITHYHADHMMGFLELLNKYKVKNVLVTAHQPDDLLYKIWADRLSEKNIKATIVKAGDKFIISDELYWLVILADSHHEDYNENSLVIRLTYKDQNFIFMGDLGFEGEEKILSSGMDISAKYLKVGHHGSKYSSSLEFLEAVSPEICIIQSGKDNKFGHPHQETLDRLKNIGCQVINTQEQGTININLK